MGVGCEISGLFLVSLIVLVLVLLLLLLLPLVLLLLPPPPRGLESSLRGWEGPTVVEKRPARLESPPVWSENVVQVWR